MCLSVLPLVMHLVKVSSKVLKDSHGQQPSSMVSYDSIMTELLRVYQSCSRTVKVWRTSLSLGAKVKIREERNFFPKAAIITFLWMRVSSRCVKVAHIPCVTITHLYYLFINLHESFHFLWYPSFLLIIIFEREFNGAIQPSYRCESKPSQW